MGLQNVFEFDEFSEGEIDCEFKGGVLESEESKEAEGKEEMGE